MKKILLLLITGIFLYSCGGQGDKVKNENIKKTTVNQLERIEYGLNDKTLIISNSCAIKSKDFENIFFIGVKFSNGEIGVWSTGGITFSVNDVAQKYSDYPSNSKKVNMSDHGASEVLDYLKNTPVVK
jgi:hypothetical protein